MTVTFLSLILRILVKKSRKILFIGILYLYSQKLGDICQIAHIPVFALL
ncbi:hypothetical protein TREPR_1402 [Treponema primitia ZAS-2]|uniref:Uncharacterized protein n=1 Tax=Treponema primitia (strain ATCC BAA-887 / DSM 12427 / ZAS-2) TaxID=545694 RepID=F5YQ86_TREPZ|nr:hypothetical protein TREPR_1402 [Treponema primitia ZAS-2]